MTITRTSLESAVALAKQLEGVKPSKLQTAGAAQLARQQSTPDRHTEQGPSWPPVGSRLQSGAGQTRAQQPFNVLQNGLAGAHQRPSWAQGSSHLHGGFAASAHLPPSLKQASPHLHSALAGFQHRPNWALASQHSSVRQASNWTPTSLWPLPSERNSPSSNQHSPSLLSRLLLAGIRAPADTEEAAPTSLELHGAGKYGLMKTMDPRYEGEHIPGNDYWKNSLGFESHVKYLNEDERQAFKLTVKDGLIYDAKGELFDSSKGKSAFGGTGAIFVMDKDGDLFASTSHTVGKFHHSSFLEGNPVSAAGEILVENGALKKLTRESGHYKPTETMLYNASQELHSHGVDFSSVNVHYEIPARRQ